MPASNLRYTLRSFRRNPGFAAIAVFSLALGIGANTAIFSLLDQILLRSLPVHHPEQLALFTANGPRRGGINTMYDDTFTFSYPMYLDFRNRAPDLAGHRLVSYRREFVDERPDGTRVRQSGVG